MDFKLNINICPEHNKKINTFCKTCKRTGCVSCMEDHEHDTFTLKTSLMSEIEFLGYLGEGGYGDVYSVKKNNEMLCLKMIKADEGQYHICKQEIDFLSGMMDCKHIIRYHSSRYLKDEKKFAIFMELADHDLCSEIDKLDQETAIKYFKNICKGVKFIHDHNKIHRDLNLKNILIKDGVAKLCDFGISLVFDQTMIEVTNKTKMFGTLKFLPPEVLNGAKYNQSCDVWALGVILHFMLTNGKFIVKGDMKNKNEIKTKIINHALEIDEKINDGPYGKLLLGNFYHFQ